MATKYINMHYVFDEVEFGIALREWRLNQGFDQQRVADMVGYKTGTSINAVERGRLTEGFPMDKFVALSNLMDIPCAYFFTLEANDVQDA